MPPTTSALLDAIRNKVLRLLPFADPEAGFPPELGMLELRSLLNLVWVLGSCGALGFDEQKRTQLRPVTAVNSAARILSSWPERYFELLARMSSPRVGDAYDVRRQYAPLYNAVLKRDSRRNPDEFQFLRLAFLRFVSDRVGFRVADHRLMRDLGESVDRRYISRAELGRINNATQRTVTRLTKGATAQNSGVIEERGRIVIDRELYALPTHVSGNIFTIREAARALEMPVSVLRLLRERELYEVVHMSSGLPGFHERDLDHFKNRLRSVALRSLLEPNSQRSVALSDVLRMRHWSCAERVNLIEALFAGRLSCFAASTEDGSALLLPELQMREWINAVRQQSADVTGIDACSFLHCDFDTLRALIAANYIKGTSCGGKWRISRTSMIDFNKNNMPLADLAESLGHCSRKAEQLCSTMNIAILRLTLRSGRARLYVNHGDIERIRAVLEQRKTTPAASRIEAPLAHASS